MEREHDARAVPARSLEHADGAEHVHVGVEVGPLDGGADVGLRGEVEADLGPGGVEDDVCIAADVALVQHRVVGQVRAGARGEVVEHVHLVAAPDERVHDVRADEARPSGHQRPHPPDPRSRVVRR